MARGSLYLKRLSFDRTVSQTKRGRILTVQQLVYLLVSV